MPDAMRHLAPCTEGGIHVFEGNCRRCATCRWCDLSEREFYDAIGRSTVTHANPCWKCRLERVVEQEAPEA